MNTAKYGFSRPAYKVLVTKPDDSCRSSQSESDDCDTREGRYSWLCCNGSYKTLVCILIFSNVIFLLFGIHGHINSTAGVIDAQGYHNLGLNSQVKLVSAYYVQRCSPGQYLYLADISKSGKDPNKTIRAPSSWGFGSNSYIAQVEVFHQIDCLNELRKEMNYDYYYKSPLYEVHRAHKTHCLHMLLQSLMCNADVGIITHNWVHKGRLTEPKTRLMPDFNIVKRCADFDGLVNWVKENAVQDLSGKASDLKYVEGMIIVPGDGYA